MAPYKIKRPAQNAWRVRGGFFQVCRLLGGWWPAYKAGLRGSAIGRRKKTAFNGGYVYLGRRTSLQIFALELYMLFGLSELSHKKIKYQLLFLKFDLSKML